MNALTRWYSEPNMTLENGKPSVFTLFHDPSFGPDFRTAVHDLQWTLDMRIRYAADSVANATLDIKDVLNNFTDEARFHFQLFCTAESIRIQ